MRKILNASLLFLVTTFSLSAQTNIQVLGHLPYTAGIECSNLTGYTDTLGREYALVGHSLGLSIVAIDTPTNPRELFLVPGATGQQGLWREVREYKGYAYVTTEQSSGLVVVNLNYLPDSIQYHTIRPDNMRTSHTVFIDENGFAYINGTDKDQLILDLNANPYNPPLVGKYTNTYVHDCIVRNDTQWAACINDGVMKVIDMSDKTDADNPAKTLATFATPLNFAHNAWLSDDNKYLFTTDEKPNSTLTCYDVQDLSNITETDRAQSVPGTNAVIHNTYFLNNFCITSYYTYGITIFDVLRKNNLQEVGHFDSSPNFTGDGFNGAWGVWPYLPSGNIIISDIETGLWIVKPTYQRATYLEGVIKDSICQTFLNGAKVEIIGTTVSDFTNFSGKYATGTLDSGTYTIRVSKAGYLSRDYTNINLQNGVLTQLNVNLIPTSTTNLIVRTVDEATGSPLPFIRVLVQDTTGVSYQEIATNTNGEYNFCDFIQGNYNFYAGRWGKVTAKVLKNVNTLTDTITIAIKNGYYDDFIMDYGWTVASTAPRGKWQRAEPAGTNYQGVLCNPNIDVANDFGDQCYTTGNNGGSPGDDDVDDGYTQLSSPLFNLTGYQNPYINYYCWFFNNGGSGSNPNDSLLVYLSNGIDTILVDKLTADSAQGVWRFNNLRVQDYIATTANMRILFKTEDVADGHLVEAAVDKFMVVDSAALPNAVSILTDVILFTAYPNPFSADVYFKCTSKAGANSTIELTNTIGQIIYTQPVSTTSEITHITQSLPAGIYYARLITDEHVLKTIKLVKAN